ncbi:rCG62898 [Rattus norvegicus]|uniref:RCG62898 n=1 Tax=Rattus norvegicus TaxID=10116 RepID=A6KQM4_RAT|nr:rCG62898 [Rattus norvegicus]
MASVGSPLSSLDIVGAVGPRVSKRSEEGDLQPSVECGASCSAVEPKAHLSTELLLWSRLPFPRPPGFPHLPVATKGT